MASPHAPRPSSLAAAFAACALAGAALVACGSDTVPLPTAATDAAADVPVALPALDAGSIGAGARSDAGPSPSAAVPTWHEQIAPIVVGRCSGCHQPGGIAPFSLVSHAQAAPFAAAMADAVNDNSMPPWHAETSGDCTPRQPFHDDPRLSDAEKALLTRWAEADAPEGDPRRAAALPAPPSTALERPSRRLAMAAPYEVAGQRDLFRCFVLPHEFGEEVWLDGLQVVPGNQKVVHHVLVWLDQNRQSDRLAGADGGYECFGSPGFDAPLMAAWAPGAMPTELPAGVGLRVPKGSKIVINVHYHPSGAAQADASAVDLRWTTKRPTFEARLALIGNARGSQPGGDGLQPGPNDPAGGPAFSIPPQVTNHTEAMRYTVPRELPIPVRLFAVGAHMHYVGTDMRIEIDRGDRFGGAPAGEPRNECLLQTTRWDFHWQRAYNYRGALDRMPTVRAGDVLSLRCTYDNSTGNRFVVQALREQGLKQPRTVQLGEETLDEMCLGIFGIAVPLF